MRVSHESYGRGEGGVVTVVRININKSEHS